MSAVIYVDPQSVHPVINDEWHRLNGVVGPDQTFTTLCGITDTATFLPLSERRTCGVPQQCDSCDVIYRRGRGIPLRQDRLRGAGLGGRRQQTAKTL